MRSFTASAAIAAGAAACHDVPVPHLLLVFDLEPHRRSLPWSCLLTFSTLPRSLAIAPNADCGGSLAGEEEEAAAESARAGRAEVTRGRRRGEATTPRGFYATADCVWTAWIGAGTGTGVSDEHTCRLAVTHFWGRLVVGPLAITTRFLLPPSHLNLRDVLVVFQIYISSFVTN